MNTGRIDTVIGCMRRLGLVCAISLVFSGNALAMTGPELAQKVYGRDDGDDAVFHTEMVLVDKNGNERVRTVQTLVKDFDGLVKSYLEFSTPPDIEGTKFLSWENAEGDDTQYLYLPELGRARRIVSSQKKLRFVNTDFSYEDMQRRKPSEDEHTILGKADYFGKPAVVLESIPKSADTSQYGKRISVIDRESLVPVAIDYYDRKGHKIKEFRVYRLNVIEGIWTAEKVEMRDLQADHRTRMTIQRAVYNRGIDDATFEVRNLEN